MVTACEQEHEAKWNRLSVTLKQVCTFNIVLIDLLVGSASQSIDQGYRFDLPGLITAVASFRSFRLRCKFEVYWQYNCQQSQTDCAVSLYLRSEQVQRVVKKLSCWGLESPLRWSTRSQRSSWSFPWYHDKRRRKHAQHADGNRC